MTGQDWRTVGGLLRDCEYVARQVLMDVDVTHAATMLRTWGEVVDSASELWQALTPNRSDVTMDRLQVMTTALHRSTRGQPWPGDGPADEWLLQISENLTRAADLVRSHVAATRPVDESARRDLDTAKARLMHTLYVGSHGVAVTVAWHVRDLEVQLATRGRLPFGESLHHSRAAQSRLAAFEQLTGSHVARTYHSGLVGEHRGPPDRDRLAQALAAWDVQAHRTVATTIAGAGAADLRLISHIQALITARGNTLIRAAASTGHIEQEQYRARLSPAMDSAQKQWADMADLWKDLTPPADRVTNAGLGLAAQEARAALNEIVLEGTTVASPELMAARADPDLARTAQTIQQALSTSAELAHVIRDATTSPDLTGAARTVNAIARNEQDIKTSPVVAWVNPRDHATNTAVQLPKPVREALTDSAQRVVDASTTAMSAAAFLDHGPRPYASADGDTPSTGRDAQDRIPPTMNVNAPRLRCER